MRARTVVGLALAALTVLAACATSTTPAGDTSASTTNYYVSIGDSYAAGYQPAHGGVAAGTGKDGFAYRVAARSPGLTLVNFGCAGATSSTLRRQDGCAAANLGPNATPYSTQSQLAAATQFIAAHPGHVSLITVVVGGNDLLDCGSALRTSWSSCAGTALGQIRTNIGAAVQAIRTAVGAATPIVGISYPDVYLGLYLQPGARARALAAQSIGYFSGTLNPLLRAAYASAGASFVDGAAATGADDPVTVKQAYGSLGPLPRPVAELCRLTYVCDLSDIHPKPAGYAVIADQVISTARLG